MAGIWPGRVQRSVALRKAGHALMIGVVLCVNQPCVGRARLVHWEAGWVNSLGWFWLVNLEGWAGKLEGLSGLTGIEDSELNGIKGWVGY